MISPVETYQLTAFGLFSGLGEIAKIYKVTKVNKSGNVQHVVFRDVLVVLDALIKLR